MATALPRDFAFELPAWVHDEVSRHAPLANDDEARMRLAIDLAAGNLAAGDGGPFGALVVDADSGDLLAAGVNLVFAAHASFAHGEMVALTLAQRRLRTSYLAEHDLTLYTSAEPCAMCLGAMPWSGIRRLVCAATDADIRAAGFDEGAKPPGWVEALQARGIAVTRECLRGPGARVLADYAAGGGRIY